MTTKQPNGVAANLRAEIARRQRRQADLADVWGISEMAVSRRVNGFVPITAEQAAQAAQWLGLDVSDLFAVERAS